MSQFGKIDAFLLGTAATAFLALVGLTIEDHRAYSPVVGFMVWTLIGSAAVLVVRRFRSIKVRG
ncbi:hypothetical protein HZF05_17100 [Sphingomonas sp. CGMCC 1.13654]|uniref:Uncharacterized protein n=1 Tax=Sphingomonas chungangi TaxID=2683589 RepID=A0A838LB33_9SPHN|nr:hypothetical protein [Sphingomonas chungangi]MBA2935799.1 hypothetical protein [Sphingomonas chungangi]MVW54490.1 hypothetical protein [Sphingomonas chungangi]